MNVAPKSGLEHRLAHLEATVARQERSLRRHRAVALGALLLAAGSVMVAATAQRAIPALLQAQRLEIVSAEGKPLFSAGQGANGGRLEIIDGAGNVVLVAEAGGTGGQVDLWNADGRNVLRTSCNEHGGDLAIWNNDGQNVMGAFATTTGAATAVWSREGSLAFRAATGEAATRLEVLGPGAKAAFMAAADATGGSFEVTNAAGSPFVAGGRGENGVGGLFTVYAADGTRSAAMTCEDDGCGRLDVYNNADKAVFTVDGQRDLGCVMALSNNVGSRLFMLGTRATGGLLNVMNDRGEVLAMFGVAENGAGAMALKNSSGMEVVHAGADDKRDGVVTVRDAANAIMKVLRPAR